MLRQSDHRNESGGLQTAEVTSRAPLQPEEAGAFLWGGGNSQVSKAPHETVRDRIEKVRGKRKKEYSSVEREAVELKPAAWNENEYMSSDAVDFGAYLLKPGFKGWEGASSFEAICFSSYLLQSAPGFAAQKPLPGDPPKGKGSHRPRNLGLTSSLRSSQHAGPESQADSDGVEEIPPSQIEETSKESTERTKTLVVREKIRSSFLSQYDEVSVSDCRSPTCVGPVIYWSKAPCLLFPVNWKNNHWVGVAVDNAQCLRKLPSETSGSKRPTIVIMDSWDGRGGKAVKKAVSSGTSDPVYGEQDVKEPEWHKELVARVRKALYAMFGADDALCAACKGVFEREKTSPHTFGHIVAVSPRVPHQNDCNQCGAMTLLALQSFVRRPVFRRHCVAGTRSPFSPTLAFYSHSDAVALRRYIRDERDRFLSNQSEKVLPGPFNDRPDVVELRRHIQEERYRLVTEDFSMIDQNVDVSPEEVPPEKDHP